ncbi:hypothetical protein ASF10_20385 [Flavobacterium sp. Leaf82]|jgi:hypothetical protein|nr:hypothetical protein ASF10_20385 [Flavobacterium sp. Leaf82]
MSWSVSQLNFKLNNMSDDLGKKRPQDSSKISLTESWEVNYWCKELGISEVELREAVKAVGHSAAAVRKYLGK